MTLVDPTHPPERDPWLNKWMPWWETDEDRLEAKIPGKYRDMDDNQFEKFKRHDDWD